MLAILGRIAAFALGVAILAFAALLYSPTTFGPGTAPVSLGVFLETYRPAVVLLIAVLGAGLVLAAVKRPATRGLPETETSDHGRSEPREEPVHREPFNFDLGSHRDNAPTHAKSMSGSRAVARPLW